MLLSRLLSLRYLVLVALGVLMVGAASADVVEDNDWYFFAWGSDILLGDERPLVRSDLTVEGDRPGGLDIYASYPFLQIGPPALLLAVPISLPTDEGVLLAAIVVQGLGFLLMLLAERTFPASSPGRSRLVVLLGGGAMTVVWGALTQYRHLDDALTLAGMGLAALALRKQAPRWTGLALGVAAASKPWGMPLLAFALALPGWRDRCRCLAMAVAAIAVFWLPFVIANPDTLRVGEVSLFLSAESTLRILELHELITARELRLLQFGVGLALAALVVHLGSWHLAPLVAFAWRLLIEPSTYSYYGAAVVAAAVLADLGSRRLAFPAYTLFAATGWVAAEAATATGAGWVRLTTYGGLTIAGIVFAVRARRDLRDVVTGPIVDGVDRPLPAGVRPD